MQVLTRGVKNIPQACQSGQRKEFHIRDASNLLDDMWLRLHHEDSLPMVTNTTLQPIAFLKMRYGDCSSFGLTVSAVNGRLKVHCRPAVHANSLEE